MSHGPMYYENILDSVKKDLNIENLMQHLSIVKAQADAWVPNFSVDTDANSGESVQFKLHVGDQAKPTQVQGVTYTLSKKDVIYLADGNSLVEDIAENLVTLYEAQLKNLIRSQITHLAANIKTAGRK